MQSILAVTTPFFALVLIGYLAAWRRLIPEAAVSGMNAFVLYFALPCLLFRFGMNTPVLQLLDPSVLGVYVACALCIIAITVGMTWRGGLTLKDSAFGALVAAFPNTGFMGVPLLATLFGHAAAGPVICTVLADLFVTSSVCIALAESHGAAQDGARSAAWKALKAAFGNPLPWSIALGALSSASGMRPLGPLDGIVRMLAESATPVAMFTIGAVLWRSRQHAHTRTPVSRYLPVALVKLVLHPALVAGMGWSAQALGAPLSNYQLIVLTLAAALPSASNVSPLAERYGADNGRIAQIILASTVLSFASFSTLAWLFGAGAPR